MMHNVTDRCRTSLAAVSCIKTVVARDAVFLLSNGAPSIRIRYYYYYFACGMVLYV